MHDILNQDPSNTTRFLFGEDDSVTSPDIKSYLQMNTTEDNCPVLIRHNPGPSLVSPDRFLDSSIVDRQMQLSASSAALDLATSPSPGPEGISTSNGWGVFTRHRSSQSQQLPLSISQAPTNGSVSTARSNDPISPISVRPNSSYRHSLDLQYYDQEPMASQVSSPPKMTQATPPKLQSSYSANDVPTVRSSANGLSSINTTPNSHAQQHLHNHNASLGRIPPNAMNRLSRELPSPETATLREAQNGGYQSIQSALQANAAPFGPSLSQNMSQAPAQAPLVSPTAQQQYPPPVPGYYNNYNMQNNMQMMNMNMSMQNMSLGQSMYPNPNQYGGYGGQMYSPQGQPRDSQARVIQQRRQNDGEGEFTKFCLSW